MTLRENGYWTVFRVNNRFKMGKIKFSDLGIERDGLVELQVMIRDE